MSRIDAYEYQHRFRRGPRKPQPKRADRREPQLALKLAGGLTARERHEGSPFDDSIDHIGR